MSEIVATMTNLAESGQDAFVSNWATAAKIMMHEQGISYKYLNSADADYVLGMAAQNLIDDGVFSQTTKDLIATLRVNHPRSEDKDNV